MLGSAVNGKEKSLSGLVEVVRSLARRRLPQRWSGEIRNWTLSDVVWLNPEREVDCGQKRKAA